MESEPRDDDLIADLRTLGRSVSMTPAGADLATTDRTTADRTADLASAVLARLTDVPPPHRANPWPRFRDRVVVATRRRRRQILVATAIVLLGCLGVPGVRAAVVDWFTFDGVKVHIAPTPNPSLSVTPPPTALGTTLDRARTMVDFRPVVLTTLGTPQRVEVSVDRRVLSLIWDGENGTIRLDEFDGTLDYVFGKTAPDVEWTTVADVSALWFDKPHEVVILDAAGNRRTETARLAGHTLIWEHEGTALRLEGDFTRERAVEIATSAESLR